MRSYVLAAALLLAAAPLAAQDATTDAVKDKDITLRGCVVPGTNDTYALTQLQEQPGPGGAVMPAVAHGRHVVFWLKNDADVKSHPNQMVEVSGHVTDIKKSEIELKAGKHDQGGLIAEFEGPGRDVKVDNAKVADAIGTSGRTKAESDDVKTFVVEFDVKDVKTVAGTCQ